MDQRFACIHEVLLHQLNSVVDGPSRKSPPQPPPSNPIHQPVGATLVPPYPPGLAPTVPAIRQIVRIEHSPPRVTGLAFPDYKSTYAMVMANDLTDVCTFGPNI